jgi:hypothetical protein
MVSNSQKFISDYYDDLDLPSDFAFVRAPSREPLRQSRTERSGGSVLRPNSCGNILLEHPQAEPARSIPDH